MVSVTVTITEDAREELKSLGWVNWSELAREETKKKVIFDNYMKTGKITKEENEFCEEIDWHPVDELPMREEHRRDGKKAERKAHQGKCHIRYLQKCTPLILFLHAKRI
ncbi:MAG: hypothetical protein WC852_06590 [Candidatus Nanoarchaeia archaeon]|jgi:hypothetical protein